MAFTSFAAFLILIAEYGYTKAVVEAYTTEDFAGIWNSLTTALNVPNPSLLLFLQAKILVVVPMLTGHKYTLIFNSLYVLTTILFKISLAIFFLRIVVAPWQRRLIVIATALFSAFSFAYIFITNFRCGAPKDILLNTARGKCLSISIVSPLLYVSGISNAMIDVMFAVLPTTILWNSQMPKKRKISCCILLSMGGLSCVASIVRIAFLSGVDQQAHYFDNAINTALVSIVEAGLAITAASLGTLRPLFQAVAEKTSLHSWQSSNNSRSAKSAQQKDHNSSGFSGTTVGSRARQTDTDSMTELDTLEHDRVVMSRAASTRSERSLLDHEDQDEWTTYDGKGVMKTREVRVSGI
jgi:hypothetical protein